MSEDQFTKDNDTLRDPIKAVEFALWHASDQALNFLQDWNAGVWWPDYIQFVLGRSELYLPECRAEDGIRFAALDLATSKRVEFYATDEESAKRVCPYMGYLFAYAVEAHNNG